jgi:hypothetical protein
VRVAAGTAGSSSMPPQPPPATAAAASVWQYQVAGIAARLRARSRGSELQPSREDAFLLWQEQRAATRAGSVTGCVCSAAAGASAPAVAGARVHAAGAAATSCSHNTPSTGYALSVPETVSVWPETRMPVAEQVSALVAAGGPTLELAIRFARELFRQVPSSMLASVCDDAYGPLAADSLTDSDGGLVEQWEPGSSPATTAGVVPQLYALEVSPARPLLSTVVSQRRCFCCDDEVGQNNLEVCAALQMYDTLLEDLHERDAIMAREHEAGIDPGESSRAARKFMYRTFVAAQYGHLGYGVRVRIPDCVKCAIRWRYPNPGCDCSLSAIATCTRHGYMGHRDA